MIDTSRLKQLSGLHPQRAVLEDLKSNRQKSIDAYDQLIREVEQGRQLDEGLFTSLKATLATVGQLGAAGAKKVKDAARKISSDVKEVYLSNKARAELTQMVKNMNEAAKLFEKMEKDSATIFARDAEIKEAMTVFKNLFNKTSELLAARQQVAIKTEGLLDQPPLPILTDEVTAFMDTKPE